MRRVGNILIKPHWGNEITCQLCNDCYDPIMWELRYVTEFNTFVACNACVSQLPQIADLFTKEVK